MATAAMQGAYVANGIDAVYQVDAAKLPADSGSDPVLRAAAACHQLLLRRYPNQVGLIEPLWNTWRDTFQRSAATQEEAYGRALALAIHNHVNKDQNGNPDLGDQALAGDGKYKPAGPFDHDLQPIEPDQGFAGMEWGRATRLKASPVDGFAKPPGRTGAGPGEFDPTDQHYLDDFNLILAKGGSPRDERIGDEEITGVFWAYDGPPELGTPPRLYMQVALAVLDQFHARKAELPLSDELKVIAGIGVAMADAWIEAWRYKYSLEHMLWRPTLGIPHANHLDWVPYGQPDTNGTLVGLTPNLPAYPSGHATFGAAAFQVLRLFLAEKLLATFDSSKGGTDNVRFTFTSDEYDGRNTCPRTGFPRPVITRTYESLWDAIVDNSVSRVYLGVHWQFDGVTVKPAGDGDGEFGVPATPAELGNRGGVWLGMQIANQIARSIGVGDETIAASGVPALPTVSASAEKADASA